jgi:hypothetical protein
MIAHRTQPTEKFNTTHSQKTKLVNPSQQHKIVQNPKEERNTKQREEEEQDMPPEIVR